MTVESPGDLLIVATVGLCGVGKSEASRFLTERLGTDTVYFGGIVRAEIHRRGEPLTPTSESAIREELRRERGMDVVARMAEEQIRAALSRNRAVVIDGLYSFAEYGFLKSIFGPELVLIALHAARETRYARLALRPERPLSRPEVDARDLHEIQYLEKAPPIVLADYHILNNSSIEELQGALEVVLQSAR